MRHFQSEAHLVVVFLMLWWNKDFCLLQPKKSRAENVFTFNKFCQGGKVQFWCTHESWLWLLDASIRGWNYPWVTLDSWPKFQELCEFFQLKMTIYVTRPLCLGRGCGVARVQYSVVPLHDSCGNVGQNKASLAIVGMPHVWTSHHFSQGRCVFITTTVYISAWWCDVWFRLYMW